MGLNLRFAGAKEAGVQQEATPASGRALPHACAPTVLFLWTQRKGISCPEILVLIPVGLTSVGLRWPCCV